MGRSASNAEPVPSAKCVYSNANTLRFFNVPKLRMKQCFVFGLGMYCPDPIFNQ